MPTTATVPASDAHFLVLLFFAGSACGAAHASSGVPGWPGAGAGYSGPACVINAPGTRCEVVRSGRASPTGSPAWASETSQSASKR